MAVKYQNPVMELTEQQLRLLAFPPNAEGNAEAVKFLYGDVIRYTNEWQWWDGTKWVDDAKSSVIQLVITTLQKRQELAVMTHNTVLEKRCACNLAPIMNVVRLLKASF